MGVGVKRVTGLVAFVLACAACSGGGDEATPATGEVTTSSATDEIFTPTGSDPETATSIDTGPTTEITEPDPAATNATPPSTDLIGDPQPDPEATRPPPPSTAPGAPPPPAACVRLAAFGVEEVVEDRTGQSTISEIVSNEVCRIRSGDVLVEVHFVTVDEVLDDWVRRDGVEPVGQVGPDAVGLNGFMTPSGDSGAGYTVATLGNAQGVVVAASASIDAPVYAADVAVFAQQAG